MKWFKTVFLPSLEERYNQRNGKMWLTEKQVNVCKNYMVGSPTVHGVFSIEIGNKMYSIHIGKHGCASFLIMIDGWTVSHT
jgi:hypothetical protein